jgi:hypothetical protein
MCWPDVFRRYAGTIPRGPIYDRVYEIILALDDGNGARVDDISAESHLLFDALFPILRQIAQEGAIIEFKPGLWRAQ